MIKPIDIQVTIEKHRQWPDIAKIPIGEVAYCIDTYTLHFKVKD